MGIPAITSRNRHYPTIVPLKAKIAMCGKICIENWRNTAGWPWTPMIYDEVTYNSCANPNPNASNPCLLGAKPEWIPCAYAANCQGGCDSEGESQCEGEGEGEADCCHNGFYLKPAYYGLREAIENYFGVAHVIRNDARDELVRFVFNGNVIVFHGETLLGAGLEGGIHVLQSASVLDAISIENTAYMLVNGDCERLAVVTQGGGLYLAGQVYDNETSLVAPASGAALVVKNADGVVVSMIDGEGNLFATGTVIVQGVPYVLNAAHGEDAEGEVEVDDYSIYQ